MQSLNAIALKGKFESRFHRWPRKLGLSAAALVVYQVILSCAHGKDFAFPGIPHLSQETGYKKSAIYKRIKELIDKGFLIRKKVPFLEKIQSCYVILVNPQLLEWLQSQVDLLGMEEALFSIRPLDDVVAGDKTNITWLRFEGKHKEQQNRITRKVEYRNEQETPKEKKENEANTAGVRSNEQFVDSVKRQDEQDEIQEEPQVRTAEQWKPVAAELERSIGSGTYNTWFSSGFNAFFSSDNSLILDFNTQLDLIYVKDHFGEHIVRAFAKVAPEMKYQMTFSRVRVWREQILRQCEQERKARCVREFDEKLSAKTLYDQFKYLFDLYPRQDMSKHRSCYRLFSRMYSEREQAIQSGVNENNRNLIPKIGTLVRILVKFKASAGWQKENGRFVPSLYNFLYKRYWCMMDEAA